MKRLILTTSLAIALGYPMLANAYVFDPDGVGGASAVDITAFDWQPSNVLAAGGNLAVYNFALNLANANNAEWTPLPTTFEVYSQGQLFGTTGNNISGLCTPGQTSCTGGNYEITYTLGYTETVTALVPLAGGGTLAVFSYVNTAPSFINFFYDPTKNSNNLAGTGFDDGTLILASKIVGATGGNFTAYSTTGQSFDATPDGNNYPGITTLSVPPDGNSGGSNVDIALNLLLSTTPGDLYRDPNFFLQGISQLQFANISLSAQFTSVNPSALFDSLGGGGNGANLAPNIGTSNGSDYNGTNPDFQMQTDPNTVIRASVPEPSVLALLGIALAGAGFSSRRRQNLK